jgi:hypothetical protein
LFLQGEVDLRDIDSSLRKVVAGHLSFLDDEKGFPNEGEFGARGEGSCSREGAYLGGPYG